AVVAHDHHPARAMSSRSGTDVDHPGRLVNVAVVDGVGDRLAGRPARCPGPLSSASSCSSAKDASIPVTDGMDLEPRDDGWLNVRYAAWKISHAAWRRSSSKCDSQTIKPVRWSRLVPEIRQGAV